MKVFVRTLDGSSWQQHVEPWPLLDGIQDSALTQRPPLKVVTLRSFATWLSSWHDFPNLPAGPSGEYGRVLFLRIAQDFLDDGFLIATLHSTSGLAGAPGFVGNP